MIATWRELHPLPKALGGVFAGSVQGRLLVAGGSYWEGAPWIAGSRKLYADSIYRYEANRWQRIGTLPAPCGYGASFVHGDALWLVGGQDAQGARRSIVRVRLDGQCQAAGQLPEPVMMPAYAAHAGHFYLLGGQPQLGLALRSPDLLHWEPCAPWPGPGRFFAQACSARGALYLAGGSDLVRGQRVFLRDAYRWRGSQWERLPDLPVPIQAGFAAAPRGIPHVFGGSNGTLAPFEAEFADRHPGFSLVIWKFAEERWRPAGLMPYGPVTSTIVEWQGELVIPGGEDRPAHRSARVIAGRDFDE